MDDEPQLSKSIEVILERVAGLYEQPEQALTFLREKYTKALKRYPPDELLKKAQALEQTEQDLYQKRIKNRIRRTIELLKIAFDNSSNTVPRGNYQRGLHNAEQFYSGKS